MNMDETDQRQVMNDDVNFSGGSQSNSRREQPHPDTHSDACRQEAEAEAEVNDETSPLSPSELRKQQKHSYALRRYGKPRWSNANKDEIVLSALYRTPFDENSMSYSSFVRAIKCSANERIKLYEDCVSGKFGKIAPPLEDRVLEKKARRKRIRLLKLTDFVMIPDCGLSVCELSSIRDEKEAGEDRRHGGGSSGGNGKHPPRKKTSEEIRSSIRGFRAALRDVPAQSGFPRKVCWPRLPPEHARWLLRHVQENNDEEDEGYDVSLLKAIYPEAEEIPLDDDSEAGSLNSSSGSDHD